MENETNEIAYNERLQFIAGAKTELKKLYTLKKIWKDDGAKNHEGLTFIEFLDDQMMKLENEIETNRKLDLKEIEYNEAVGRYYGYYGEYNDCRNDSPIIEGHIVDYLKAYVEWSGYDY